MLLQMALFHFFSWPGSISLYVCTKSFLSIHLLVEFGLFSCFDFVNSATVNMCVCALSRSAVFDPLQLHRQ